MPDFAHRIAYEVLDQRATTIDVRVIEAPTQEAAEARWRKVDAQGRATRLYGTLICLPWPERQQRKRGHTNA